MTYVNPASHCADMLYSSRNSSRTTLILSLVYWYFRVARWMFFTICSDVAEPPISLSLTVASVSTRPL
jgi:hypothetical protein